MATCRRLGQISKAAKERKMKERIETENNDTYSIDYHYLLELLG